MQGYLLIMVLTCACEISYVHHTCASRAGGNIPWCSILHNSCRAAFTTNWLSSSRRPMAARHSAAQHSTARHATVGWRGGRDWLCLSRHRLSSASQLLRSTCSVHVLCTSIHDLHKTRVAKEGHEFILAVRDWVGQRVLRCAALRRLPCASRMFQWLRGTQLSSTSFAHVCSTRWRTYAACRAVYHTARRAVHSFTCCLGCRAYHHTARRPVD